MILNTIKYIAFGIVLLASIMVKVHGLEGLDRLNLSIESFFLIGSSALGIDAYEKMIKWNKLNDKEKIRGIISLIAMISFLIAMFVVPNYL